MKKNIYKIALLFSIMAFSTSCSDFLDVVPKDKILEEQTYSTEAGIQRVHNGLYLQLADDNLYGQQLSMDAVEILGQQFNMSSNTLKKQISSYSYSEIAAKSVFARIWEKAYATILASNKFIQSINEYNGIISTEKADLLKGEAVAMRAMLHFDMLRLFGPIYKNAPTDPAVPYYDVAQTTSNPILPANEVIAKVLMDLDLALDLLKNDPVLTVGKDAASTAFNANPYYASKRGLRLNYIAVKSLKARVLLYAGDTENAAAIAQEVIDFSKTTGFFNWTPFSEATHSTSPDRIFSSENFFALSDLNLYKKQQKLFQAQLSDFEIYAPILGRINSVFESLDNDYRNLSTWKIPTTAGKTQKTFFKYEDVADKNKSFRFQIPMLKLAEMYLIAAETAKVPADGITILNTLRYNRGLPNLATTIDVQKEVVKEYKKEFIGEGQLFFFYKRNATTSVANGSAASGNLTMGALQYVVPLPESETNFQ